MAQLSRRKRGFRRCKPEFSGGGPYQSYTLTMHREIPVVTSLGMVTNDGSIRGKGSSEFEELLSDYKLMIYNHTVDRDGRISGFFSEAQP